MALYVESFFGSVYIFYQVNTFPAACIFKSLKIFEIFAFFRNFQQLLFFRCHVEGWSETHLLCNLPFELSFWSFLLKLPFEDPFKDPPAQGELRYWMNIVIKSPLNNSAYIHSSLPPKYGFPRMQRKFLFGFVNYIPSSNLQLRFSILWYFLCFGYFF